MKTEGVSLLAGMEVHLVLQRQRYLCPTAGRHDWVCGQQIGEPVQNSHESISRRVMRFCVGIQVWLQRWTGEAHDVVCRNGVEVEPAANAGAPMPDTV